MQEPSVVLEGDFSEVEVVVVLVEDIMDRWLVGH